jgi:hypothetical protein
MAFPCEIECWWPRWPDPDAQEKHIAQTPGELRHQLANIRAAANEKQIAISVSVVTSKGNVFSIILVYIMEAS